MAKEENIKSNKKIIYIVISVVLIVILGLLATSEKKYYRFSDKKNVG